MSIFIFRLIELLKSTKNHLNKKIINLNILGILFIILCKYIIGIVFKFKFIFYITMVRGNYRMIEKFTIKLPFNVNSNITQNSFVKFLKIFLIPNIFRCHFLVIFSFFFIFQPTIMHLSFI